MRLAATSIRLASPRLASPRLLPLFASFPSSPPSPLRLPPAGLPSFLPDCLSIASVSLEPRVFLDDFSSLHESRGTTYILYSAKTTPRPPGRLPFPRAVGGRGREGGGLLYFTCRKSHLTRCQREPYPVTLTLTLTLTLTPFFFEKKVQAFFAVRTYTALTSTSARVSCVLCAVCCVLCDSVVLKSVLLVVCHIFSEAT